MSRWLHFLSLPEVLSEEGQRFHKQSHKRSENNKADLPTIRDAFPARSHAGTSFHSAWLKLLVYAYASIGSTWKTYQIRISAPLLQIKFHLGGPYQHIAPPRETLNHELTF